MSEEAPHARARRLAAERKEEKDRVFRDQAQQVASEEDRRKAAAAAKTARLRELRLAKQAAELAAKAAAKPKRRR